MAIERSVGRVFRVQHKAPGGPHVRQGFVLEPGRWAEFDPFLLMAEDWFQRGTFGDHPHRGMETVTLVLEGRLEHRDNHGGAGVLGPGDVQWMTAGGGVVHAEEPLPGETVHSLQLWVNLPRAEKMTPPAYQDLQREKLPVRREEGAKIAVISGSSGGVRGLARSRVPVTAIDASLEAGTAVEQDLPANYNGFLYVLSGSGRFGRDRTRAEAGEVLLLPPVQGGTESEMRLEAHEALRVVLFAGQPLREPVAAYGPFVMTTQEEIEQAFLDYRSGKF